MSIQKKKAEKASSFKGCAMNEWQILQFFWDLTTVRWLPWELLDCLNIADDCLAPAWWLPWHLPDDCLMTTYLCTYIRNDYLTTAWRRIAWWLPGNALMTAWPLPDDCLKSAWRLHTYFTTETLHFMTDNNKTTKSTGLWRCAQPKNYLTRLLI